MEGAGGEVTSRPGLPFAQRQRQLTQIVSSSTPTGRMGDVAIDWVHFLLRLPSELASLARHTHIHINSKRNKLI